VNAAKERRQLMERDAEERGIEAQAQATEAQLTERNDFWCVKS